MCRPLLAVGLVAALAAGTAFTAARARAGGKDPGDKGGARVATPMCPVMDEPVDFSVSVATDQGPVFFCCPACIKKHTENPEKYAAKVAAQRKVLADRPKVQVTCPVSGKAVDQKQFIEQQGQKVYFCCENCAPKYQKDPAQYASKLANSFSYQTECPVMKEEIDPAVFADLSTGQKVYFCCKKCVGKFNADPSKYADNLASQGIHLDPEKLKGGKG